MPKIEVGLIGRDQLKLEYEITGGKLEVSSFSAVGCLPFLEGASRLKPILRGEVAAITAPTGRDHVALLLQEFVKTLKGDWSLPYKEVLLCKCRSIPTFVVDQAIVAGAHDAVTVGLKTGAGTSCGTCKKDIESLILYRLKSVS
ncbi:MAG: (2Fe-2S)-binding protein [Bdellovibrionales bacterium]|nr:(2Fe-2S)-binding protein [Bdellovibrionales bacterium]